MSKPSATVGIHKLHPNRFKQLSQPLAKSNDTVTIMRGGIVSHVPLAEVLDEITAGKY